jgi:hypothetical protein
MNSLVLNSLNQISGLYYTNNQGDSAVSIGINTGQSTQGVTQLLLGIMLVNYPQKFLLL